jgi:hypothetical protein
MRRNIWLFCAAILAANGYAQTWVSGTGSDSNSCTRSAPCKTYQHAHDVTAAFGQITALDAGDFGPVTITKGITIDGAGVATNFATGASEITVNAGTGDVVQLRNLSIHGRNAPTAITYNSGSQLHIDNLKVNGFNGSCIAAAVGGTGTADMVIQNTSIDHCSTGVFVSGVGPILTVEIVNSQIHYANYGVYAYSGLISISGSSFSSPGYGTTTVGILQNYHNPPFPNQRIMVDNSQFSGYDYAISTSNGSIQLSRTTLSNNTLALYANSTGSIISNGNNAFFNNGSNGSFTSTVGVF